MTGVLNINAYQSTVCSEIKNHPIRNLIRIGSGIIGKVNVKRICCWIVS